MVYDPIRDRDVPSPASSLPQQRGPWREINTPGSSFSSTGDGGSNGRAHPPAFHDDLRSPAGISARSLSGGLRGLLNEDAIPRRGSEHSSSISSAAEEGRARPSFHQLLNTTPAAPISKTSSSNSLAHSSSPSNSSPGTRHRHLAPSGFATPAAPIVTQPRTNSTPLYPVGISPRTALAPLPYQDTAYASYYSTPQAGPSHRRQSSGSVQRPMLPPQELPPQYYDYGNRITPGSASIPLRSPSVSVSPRSYHMSLSQGYGTSSRPGSSTSQPFAYQPPPLPVMSPALSSRRFSDDHVDHPSSDPYQTGRPGVVLPRRSSQITPVYSPSYAQLRSPSPSRTAYDPRRITQPSTVLLPIHPSEVAHLRNSAMANNPLRRKKRRPLPSWSGPSPSGREIPTENEATYFPVQGEVGSSSAIRRMPSYTGRRGSASSSTSRPALTPRGSAYPPAFDERFSQTVSAARPRVNSQTQHMPTGNGEINHRKRPSEREDNEHDTTRRKVSEAMYVGNAEAVAYHYNARPEVGVQYREFSPIIGLKKFNNWIKSVLIGKFARRGKGAPGANVLDIGCGKGGDLNKWKQARIRLYVGLDIAETSVEQARDRYLKMGRAGFDGHFFAWDCYSKPITDILPEPLRIKDLYDNVTMQFCMHYAFESVWKARMMIENVSRYLRPGGIFIGTIPNAELLLERLHQLPEDDDDLRFGNSCYYVQFAERRHKGVYGHQYRFFLTDAVEDVPEYLVNWEFFVSLATEYRLRLVYKKAFNEVLQEEQSSRDFGSLLGKMGVVNDRGESAMDADQWEAANLYMAFVFEKQ